MNFFGRNEFKDEIFHGSSIGSGNLVEKADGDKLVPSACLDPFALHDAVIFSYQFNSAPFGKKSIFIKGLLPDYQSFFGIEFHGVRNFLQCSFDQTNFFAISELQIKKDIEFIALFIGEFKDQFFSFDFCAATYEKFRSIRPLSHAEIFGP